MSNKNGSKWIRPERRLAIYMRDDWHCVYCECDLSCVKPRFRTLDHVIGRTDGGSNETGNLVTCCKRCNDRKNAKDAYDFCKSDTVRERLYRQLSLPINIKLARDILAGNIDQETTTDESD